MRGYKKLITNARKYLETIDNTLGSLTNQSEDFYVAMREFYDFFNEINELRAIHIDELIFPEDIDDMLERVNSKFKIKNFNNDEGMWLEHIQDSVNRLNNLYNLIPKTLKGKERRVIQDSVQRHYRQLTENIYYYEKTFEKMIPRSTTHDMNKCIKDILVNYNIYIKSKEDIDLVTVKIESVEYDDAIDLHQKIQKSKGVTKKKLKRELDRIMQVLKEN